MLAEHGFALALVFPFLLIKFILTLLVLVWDGHVDMGIRIRLHSDITDYLAHCYLSLGYKADI
jgi:hypothetical protein